MLGKTTLFAPGFDHAGISTQSAVEKRLYKTTGQTRHDLGREKFLGTVLDWKNECVCLSAAHISRLEFNVDQSYQARITNQLRRLGGSYDWTRVAFTMDEVYLCSSDKVVIR
jgi:valyl-tRNA synthetase